MLLRESTSKKDVDFFIYYIKDFQKFVIYNHKERTKINLIKLL